MRPHVPEVLPGGDRDFRVADSSRANKRFERVRDSQYTNRLPFLAFGLAD